MSNKKPFLSYVVGASVLPALLLTSTLSFAASDAEIADLKARIAALEATPSWSSTEQQGADPLSIHGFISAGVSTANSDFGADSSTNNSSVGGGATDGVTDFAHYQKNQVLGLQVGYQLAEETDIGIQILGRGLDNEYDAHIEWAYIGQVLAENKGPLERLKLRAGKLPVSTYLISEYFDVGIAYPWIKPPYEVYSTVGGASLYGFDLSATWGLPNDWSMVSQVFVGENDVDPKFGEGDAQDFQDIFGYNLNFYKDAWAFRVGFAQTKVTLENSVGGSALLTNGAGTAFNTEYAFAVDSYNSVDALIAADALNLLDSQFAGGDITGLFGGTNPYTTFGGINPYSSVQLDTAELIPASFAGVGFSYDNGSLLAYGELTELKIDVVQPGSKSGYLTLGYHYGDLTPYATYAFYERGEADEADAVLENLENFEAAIALGVAEMNAAVDAGAPGAAANAPTILAGFAGLQSVVDQLDPIKERLLDTRPQETYTLGLRYDFVPGAAIKAEVQQITGLEGKYTNNNGKAIEDIYVTNIAIQAAF